MDRNMEHGGSALKSEYTAAVARERSAWARLRDPEAAHGDGSGAYEQWRAAAERTKLLAVKLQEARLRGSSSAACRASMPTLSLRPI